MLLVASELFVLVSQSSKNWPKSPKILPRMQLVFALCGVWFHSWRAVLFSTSFFKNYDKPLYSCLCGCGGWYFSKLGAEGGKLYSKKGKTRTFFPFLKTAMKQTKTYVLPTSKEWLTIKIILIHYYINIDLLSENSQNPFKTLPCAVESNI